ncbi:MAG: 5-(carboxyamino)imidazole ribonucleotide synthase [Lewinellaceae bacterium]|nr:5-(carboxyamino)imidazole ribonucleotide synthase [Lewinellaceae bacterium]
MQSPYLCPMFSTTQKIGVLGGGQLGKMLCLAAAEWDLKTYVLDTSPDYPAGQVCTGFTAGNFNSYDDVLAFGRDMDILTIEIEHVNTDALLELERLGKRVYPSPASLNIIKDKGLQKLFYRENDIPTARFELFDSEKALKEAVRTGKWSLPLVQKTRSEGYDGKGVAIIRTLEDMASKLLPGACLAEELAPIRTEIAVVAARNPSGEVTVFPPVEMDFHPEANLVEFLLCPARISPLVAAEAETLAEHVIRTLDVCGLLAVEMFLTTDGHLLVNEVAPRPHNSGHHTIDSARTSQFQQHLRAICDLPLGSTEQKIPAAVMLNLLGEPGHKGPVHYEGVEECLALDGVHIHLYGKALTSPFRKMGHVTITGETTDEALKKAQIVKNTLKALSLKV